MTVAPTAPSGARRVEVVSRPGFRTVERLVAAEPIVNAVIAARLAAHRRPDPALLGGTLVASLAGRRLTGAAFHGGNLIPIGGDPDDWTALAAHVVGMPRVCTSIVGRADAVSAMWAVLEPSWGRPRAVRAAQPLLALRYRDRAVPADPRVRVIRPDDLDRYVPAAAAMFTEELGVTPAQVGTPASYRHRVRALIARGHAFGVVDGHGDIAFKADIGALTDLTAQIQGVWVRPDLRGRGFGTAAMAAVIDLALGLAPSVSLYVNDFNLTARRMYARLGMRQIATLSTVLL